MTHYSNAEWKLLWIYPGDNIPLNNNIIGIPSITSILHNNARTHQWLLALSSRLYLHDQLCRNARKSEMSAMIDKMSVINLILMIPCLMKWWKYICVLWVSRVRYLYLFYPVHTSELVAVILNLGNKHCSLSHPLYQMWIEIEKQIYPAVCFSVM